MFHKMATARLNIIDWLHNGGDVVWVQVPCFMYVPVGCIRLFLGQPLTPHQLVEEVLATFVTNCHEVDLTALFCWCLVAWTT